MIRSYDPKDEVPIHEIYLSNNLPAECFPDFTDPLILHTGVVEVENKVVMSCSIRGSCELYLFVDHNAGTPEQRWQWMQELREYIVREAWRLGLDQLSCWIPPEVEESFKDRLEQMGFQKSPWSCWTLRVSD
jgi:hypothetical protein